MLRFGVNGRAGPASTRVLARRPMTGLEWVLLLSLSVLWGGSFFFNEIAVAAVPPFTIVLFRVAVAAAILSAALRLGGVTLPRERRVWGAFLVLGGVNTALPFSLILWGQTQLASGVAAILNASTPLFTVVFAHFLTADERLSPHRLLGVLCGFAGVAVMLGGAALGAAGASVAAQAAALGAAVSYALGGIYGRRFHAWGVPPLATAWGQVTASSLLLLPVVLVVDRPWSLPAPSPAVVLALVGLAALSTALAYIIYFRLLATAGATNLMLVTLLVPVTAILLGVLALGEALLPRHLWGMALIAAGLAAIDGRALRALSRG